MTLKPFRADDFNKKYPIGTLVKYWNAPGDEPKVSTTRSKADVMSGTAVVWLEGIAGCWAVSHIRPVED